MHLLLTDIQWDDEGMGLEECRLPSTVLLIDVPSSSFLVVPDTLLPSVEEAIGMRLVEEFGFDHHGFKWERFGESHDTHAGGGFFPPRLGVIRWS